MQIRVSSDQQYEIQVTITDPLPNLPDWMAITPTSPRARFLTIPEDHYFAQWAKDDGYPGELLAAARSNLSGEIDNGATAHLITDILTRWSEAMTTGAEENAL